MKIAKDFQALLFEGVLPQIRKEGYYAINEELKRTIEKLRISENDRKNEKGGTVYVVRPVGEEDNM